MNSTETKVIEMNNTVDELEVFPVIRDVTGIAHQQFLTKKKVEKLKKYDTAKKTREKANFSKFIKNDTEDYEDDPGVQFGTTIDNRKVQELYELAKQNSGKINKEEKKEEKYNYHGPNEENDKFFKDYLRKYGNIIRKGGANVVTTKFLKDLEKLISMK